MVRISDSRYRLKTKRFLFGFQTVSEIQPKTTVQLCNLHKIDANIYSNLVYVLSIIILTVVKYLCIKRSSLVEMSENQTFERFLSEIRTNLFGFRRYLTFEVDLNRTIRQ